MAVKKNNVIEKRNILNEIRCNNMHLQELRFFTIYLSKINARDVEKTRHVRFPISDFLAIMELKKVNIADLKQTTNSLLCKVVNVPTESGGYRGFQLFKECIVDKDKDDGTWYVEIDAHDSALPLMFDFKRDYFTYELWNALRLSSSNQLRMYEILKQYERVKERTVSIEELKKLLFIAENEYPRFNDFKNRVLDACQKALKQNTDICFEYELIKRGQGGRVSSIRFIISKNNDYTDQLTINEFIDMKSNSIEISEQGIKDTAIGEVATANKPDKKLQPENATLFFMSDACNGEFSEVETQVLHNIIIRIIPYKVGKNNEMEWFDYLKRKYDEMKWQASRREISNRFGYLKKIIEADLNV